MRAFDLPDELDEARCELIVALAELWERVTDLRFGQMLREAAGDPIAIRCPAELTDTAIATGVKAALLEHKPLPPPRGPYWDTEAETGRTFMDGMPRDPARIPRVLGALARAWAAHPTLTLGQVVVLALDRGAVAENEFNSRLLLVEDGFMRRLLMALVTEPGKPGDER